MERAAGRLGIHFGTAGAGLDGHADEPGRGVDHAGGADGDEQIAVEQVLVDPIEVLGDLAGPHAAFQLRDADGQVWDITLAPGPRTYRAGLREGVIPVGATVTVQGERNADPEVFEAKTRRVIWEDRVFDVYPPEN